MTTNIQRPSFKWDELTIPRFNVMEHDGSFLRTVDGQCVLVKDLEKLGLTVKHTGEEDYGGGPIHPWPALEDKS